MKNFRNWEDAKQFNYPNENKSSYYSVITKEEELPIPVTSKRTENSWKICQPTNKEIGVYMEITPLWVTITIQKKNSAQKRDFPRNGKSVQTILHENFKQSQAGEYIFSAFKFKAYLDFKTRYKYKRYDDEALKS